MLAPIRASGKPATQYHHTYMSVHQGKLNSLLNSLINNSELVEHCYKLFTHRQLAKITRIMAFFFNHGDQIVVLAIMVQDGQLDDIVITTVLLNLIEQSKTIVIHTSCGTLKTIM